MAQDRYDCGFHVCSNDSLQILIHDLKCNRKFSNLFTKLKLESMNISFPTAELSTVLETARDAKKKKLKHCKFLIKYKSIASIASEDCGPLTPQNTLFSYKAGDKMVLFVNINEARFCMKAAFKLNEMITNSNNNGANKLSLTLSQSISLHSIASDARCAFTPTAQQLPRSPRRRLQIATARSRTKSPARARPRSQSSTLTHRHAHHRPRRKSRQLLIDVPDPISIPCSITHTNDSLSLKRKLIKPLTTEPSSEESDKIVELEGVIEALKRENERLLNKMAKRLKKESETKENKLWLKQKIGKMERNLDGKMRKEFGICFKSECEWKEIVNQSFNILQKLSKTLHRKQEQYESVSNKWMKSKKEHKELKKSDGVKHAQLEKQRNIINGLKQQIAERDASLKATKQNERNLEDKMKKMEKEFAVKQDWFNEQMRSVKEEKVRLNVRLHNSIQEMKESKTDFDELQQDNDTMHEEINKLKYSVYQTNEKSRELMECLKRSQGICDKLSSGVRNSGSGTVVISTAASDGEGDEANGLDSDPFIAAHSNSNYV